MATKYWFANKDDKGVNVVAELGSAAGLDIGGIAKLSKTLAYADFADTGTAAGLFTFGESIPVGAIMLSVVAKSVTAFSGDTSAVITVGEAGDPDRYMTGTPNVFATAADGLSLGVPSGLAYHSEAKVPIVTVTADSDWGDVDDTASITLELNYII